MAKQAAKGVLGAGAAFSAVAGAYKMGEFALRVKKLHQVGGENAVFVRLIERVWIDLQETERLLKLEPIRFALSNTPEKTAWVKNTIYSTKAALDEISKHTERVNKDLKKGHRVGVRNRFRWVMDEEEKLVIRRMELATCHQSLAQVLAFLVPLEPLACCEAADSKEKQQKQLFIQQQQQQQQQQQLPPPESLQYQQPIQRITKTTTYRDYDGPRREFEAPRRSASAPRHTQEDPRFNVETYRERRAYDYDVPEAEPRSRYRSRL